jgi:predicted dehydrogenase
VTSRLLDSKDVDAVVVATPDHWHGRMGVDALIAGKHLYIEKPMTRHLDEAFKLHDTAKRTRGIVQVGSHGCSDPKYHRARAIVKAGTAGRLLWAPTSPSVEAACRLRRNGRSWRSSMPATRRLLTPAKAT